MWLYDQNILLVALCLYYCQEDSSYEVNSHSGTDACVSLCGLMAAQTI